MTRVVIIGIDGLDADLLRVYGPSLPNLRRLMLESPFLELKSSFPPETATAWASIYTGLNPANHGILNGIPSLSTSSQETALPFKLPQGETFWDIAGRAGKRVCIINPLLAYPAWSVNGIMLSLPPAGINGCGPGINPGAECPPGTSLAEGTPLLQAIEAFPALLNSPTPPSVRQLGNYCHSLYAHTSQQAEIGLELFKREPWDLFFLQLDALDYVEHFLWRYSDPSDPTHPGRNEHAGRILDFYHLFDQILRRFRTCMDKDGLLLVVSGHGHGRRCVHKLNLNEWLRTQGYLTARTKSLRLLDRRYLAERAKRRSIQLLTPLHLYGAMLHMPRYLPGRQVVDHTAHPIDSQATVAQVVELAGTSPFGGIRLNCACIGSKSLDYSQLRKELLQALMQLRLKGSPVVNWAKARENVYQGTYTDCYPDILFELRSDFGVSADLYVPLTTTDLAHSVVSGDHRMHGVLLTGNVAEHLEILDSANEPTVMDVAPTVLRLMGVDSARRDGQALLQPLSTKQLI